MQRGKRDTMRNISYSISFSSTFHVISLKFGYCLDSVYDVKFVPWFVGKSNYSKFKRHHESSLYRQHNSNKFPNICKLIYQELFPNLQNFYLYIRQHQNFALCTVQYQLQNFNKMYQIHFYILTVVLLCRLQLVIMINIYMCKNFFCKT